MRSPQDPNDPFEAAIELSKTAAAVYQPLDANFFYGRSFIDTLISFNVSPVETACSHSSFTTVSQMVTDDSGREMELDYELCSQCNVDKSALISTGRRFSSPNPLAIRKPIFKVLK